MQSAPHPLFASLLAALCLAGCTQPSSNSLEVTDAWIRPVDASLGIAGALYLTIDNQTASPVTLRSSMTAIADTIELHQSTMTDNVMRMRPVNTLRIEPGELLTFAPGGNPLMLKNLSASLVAGDSIGFTLQFAQHPPVDVQAAVQWEKPLE